MAYDYDTDANKSSWWEQHDDNEPEEQDDDVERVTCPKHGPTVVTDYDAEANLLELKCGCDI